jgi:predicted transcriptional regulator YdeE
MENYSHPSFEITGYKFRTNSQNAFKDISDAWDKINENKLLDSIENKTYPSLHNVYFNYENQDDLQNRSYEVLIGFITETGKIQTDSNLTTIVIPAQNYKYVLVKGDMPKSLILEWEKVNAMPKSELNRAFGYDMDMYSEDGKECTLTVSIIK